MLECDAAQKILRILISSTSKSEPVQAIGKYSRALKFLGRSDQGTQQNDTRDVLRVRIGDWQVANEKYILGLVTDPENSLEPNEPNLTALRAGSIAPSYVLQLLYDDPGADPVFPDHINRLLASSLSLHPAAQASLLRGAALISAALPRASSSNRMYAESCMAVISNLDLPTDKDSFRNALNDSPQLVTYVQCILALGRLPTDSPLSQGKTSTAPDPSLRYARLKGVLDILLGQPEDQRDILPSLSVGIEEILSKPQHYSLDQSDAIQSPCEVLKRLRTYFQENIEQMDVDLANRIVSATFYTYDIAQTSTPPLSIYISMLAIFCRQIDGFNIYTLRSVLSQLSFPQISEEWMNLLHERNIIPRLVDIANASSDHGCFAATLLWLLYALLGNLPRSEYTALQSCLWDLLQTTTEPGTEVQEARLIRKGLAARILGDRDRRIHLFEYTSRIVECIYEIGDDDGLEDDGVRQHNPNWLEYVSETLRHVSSFTPPEIWNPPATQPPAEPPTTSTSPAPDHTSIAIGKHSLLHHALAEMLRTNGPIPPTRTRRPKS
ncbi:hypothetical protein B0J17DRAFT_772461 [Rhizoctonia solani]|nr:hypothetical protein B0J17DRAFT_772461 [Rhizoctonia solani]